MEKLIPYIRDIVKNWVKGIEPSPYVVRPSGNLWSFHKGKGKSNLFYRGVVASYILIESKISFYFFDEVVCKESVARKDLR